MAEDSQRAMKEVKDYDGQRISVSVAKKKQQDQRKSGEIEDLLTNQRLMQLRAINWAVWTAIVTK